MRVAVVVLGIVVILVGAVLWLVPLAPATSSIQVPVGDAYDFGVPGSLVIGNIPYKVAWTAGPDANVTIYSCGASSACAGGTNESVLAQRYGSSGSVSWMGQAGQYYLLVPNQTANVTVDYQQPVSGGLVGLGVLGAGIVLTLAGLAIPSRGSRAPPAEVEPPTEPVAEPAPATRP